MTDRRDPDEMNALAAEYASGALEGAESGGRPPP